MTPIPTKDLSFDHVFEPGDEPDPAYTLLLLHGTGADQHDLLPVGTAVAPGAPKLSPLGKVRENGMPRWFRRLREGVFDEEDIRHRASELASFLPEAATAHGTPSRYVAVGFSNGANIAGSLLLLHPRALRAAVLLRPMTPLEPDTLPDLSGVPVLLASGRHDHLVPMEDAEHMAELLREAGATVTHEVADAGHGLTREELPRIRRWLEEHADAFAQPRDPPS